MDTIRSTSFNKEYSNHYILNLLLKKQLFAYAIRDRRDDQALAFQKFDLSSEASTDEIKNIFYKHDDLRNIYHRVNVLLYSSCCTIVPERHVMPGEEKDYLQLLFSGSNGEQTLVAELPAIESRMLYAIPEDIIRFFRNHFDHTDITHSANALISTLIEKNKNCTINKCYLYINKDVLEVVVFRKGKFIYYNTFSFRTNEDFIYYILLAYDQLDLNVEQDPVILMGEIEKQSQLYAILYKYIGDIRFAARTDAWKWSEDMGSPPQHYYFNLFCR